MSGLEPKMGIHLAQVFVQPTLDRLPFPQARGQDQLEEGALVVERLPFYVDIAPLLALDPLRQTDVVERKEVLVVRRIDILNQMLEDKEDSDRI